MDADRVGVLILIGRYPPDFTGHGIQTRRLLPYLLAEGVAPTVLALEPARPDAPLGDDPAPVLRSLPADGPPLAGLRRIRAIRDHVRRHQRELDVVHATNVGWDLLANLGFFRARGLRTLYEMILLGADDPVSMRGYRFGTAKLRLLRHVDRFLGISEAFRPSLREAGIPESRFRCVYTGVDVERYRPLDPAERRARRVELGLPEDGRVLVSVGAVVHRKGFDRVIRGFAKLRPDPARDRLLVVGPTRVDEGLPEHLAREAPEVERLARDSGIGEAVRFVGRADDVERYLGAADAFVFLSRREGLGNVILEGLACGLPCVVSPLDGIGAELIDEGRTGYVVPDPDDPEAVAARLGEALDPARRDAFCRAARERALERYSMEVRARTLASLYRELARG